MIALMIIGGVMVLGGLIVLSIMTNTGGGTNDSRFAFPFIVAYFGVVILFVGSIEHGKKEGQINALKGKQAYEIQVVYRDTIPVDTLYVKIKTK